MINRIKELREDHDLTQSDLAKHVGIDQRTISNYETGKSNPDTYALIKIADYFNVSIDYLVGRTDHDFFSSGSKKDMISDIQKSLEELKRII